MWRRILALTLVVSLALPAAARAQENLPGMVSGKKIAILAAVAAAAIVTMLWLHKRSNRQPNPNRAPKAGFNKDAECSQPPLASTPTPRHLPACVTVAAGEPVR